MSYSFFGFLLGIFLITLVFGLYGFSQEMRRKPAVAAAIVLAVGLTAVLGGLFSDLFF